MLAGLSIGRGQPTRRQPLRNTARFVAAFSAGALFLKLLVLLHPDMPIGDAMFHAHRFQGVLGGNLYFTSIAPGSYSFPYPPGLYVFAAPFAGLVRARWATWRCCASSPRRSTRSAGCSSTIVVARRGTIGSRGRSRSRSITCSR